MFQPQFSYLNPPQPIQDQKHPRNLLRFVQKVLLTTPDHHKLPYINYQNQMDLYIIEKKPLYLSDGDVCIQGIMDCPDSIPKVNPFNKLTTTFYAPHQRPQIVFNCHDNTIIEEAMDYPSPYHPSFHFKDYNRFKEGRKNAQILLNCQQIVLKSWKIILVNITNSGYYAPLLIINHHTKNRENYRLNKQVENILFCEELTPLLQKCRVKDMHNESYLNIKKQQENFSLVYYMRYKKSSQKVGSRSCLINLDKQGEILKHKKMQKTAYLPIGELPKISIFKRPIQNRFISLPQVKLNYDKIYQENEEMQIERQDSLDIDLWSDEQLDNTYIKEQIGIRKKKMANNIAVRQSSQQGMEEQIDLSEIHREIEEQNQRQKYYEIESDESQPDILKNLYKQANRGGVI